MEFIYNYWWWLPVAIFAVSLGGRVCWKKRQKTLRKRAWAAFCCKRNNMVRDKLKCCSPQWLRKHRDDVLVDYLVYRDIKNPTPKERQRFLMLETELRIASELLRGIVFFDSIKIQ